MSFLNGLSQMGAGLASYATSAGLEAQKADLQQQSLVLADQLAGAREATGDTRRAGIAAQAQAVQNTFQAGQTEKTIAGSIQTANIGAGATLGAAQIGADSERARIASQEKISAAGLAQQEPFVAAQVAEVKSRAALSDIQVGQLKTSLQIQTAIADESAKPDADPKKIAALQAQYRGLNYDPKVQAAILTAADQMATTSQAAVSALQAHETATLALLKNPEINEGDRAQQEAALKDIQNQLVVARGRAQHFTSIAGGQLDNLTGTQPANTPPPLPPGVPPGSRYNFDHRVFQSPDGKLFDATGQPTTANAILPGPRNTAPPPPRPFGLLNGSGASP